MAISGLSGCVPSVGRLARDRAGHAVSAAAAAAELRTPDGDDLDPRLAQKRVGMGIAVVAHDHTGLEGDDIVAVVPLLALSLPGIAAGPDDPEALEAERLLHDLEQRSLVLADLHAVFIVGGMPAPALDLIDDLAEHRADIPVAEAEDRVQMHGSPALGHHAGDDAGGGIIGEERMGDLADRLACGPLARADEDDALADGHDIAALERGGTVILVGIPEPELEVAALEDRMILVDRPLQQGFGLARRPVHRIAGHPAIDPAGGIALEQRVGDRRDEERRFPARLGEHPGPFRLRDVADGNAADEQLRELGPRHLVEPGPHQARRARTDRIRRHATVEHEGARLLVVHGFAQELRKIEHLDSALLHLGDEVVVVLARLMDPDDVVEEEIVAVARRQPLMRAAGRADHHGLQLADLGMGAEGARHETSSASILAGSLISASATDDSIQSGLSSPVHNCQAANNARATIASAMTTSTPVKARAPRSRLAQA